MILLLCILRIVGIFDIRKNDFLLSKKENENGKEGKNKEFEELFNKYYGEHFLLLTKQEVLDQKWFGEGIPHPTFEDFIGEYMATSISKYGFTFDKEIKMIGAHSGSLEEESIISVAVINK